MKYQFNNKYILRTPLKPITTSFSKKALHDLFSQKVIQEALFLSSPNLLNEFIKWTKGEIKDIDEEDKLIYSLLKYALRMHSRCTPFGLFAGCNVIEMPNDFQEIIITPNKNFRNTRLDMNFTCALAQELSKIPSIQKLVKFYPNTSLYSLQDKIRYIEYYYKNKRRFHQISSVDNSIYLQKIISKASEGATIQELAESITDEEVSLSDAYDFIKEVISSQILVSELDPSVTGDELLNQILERLISINNKHSKRELDNIIELLENIQQQLNIIDTKLGNDIELYKKLSNNLHQFSIPFELNRLFQTDMFINIENNSKIELSEQELQNNIIQKELVNAVSVLNKLTAIPTKTNLSEFQRKFYDRYEDKQVSLLEALDTETGIGYAQNTNKTGDINPLVNDLFIPFNANQDVEFKWNDKQSFLFKKILDAKQYGNYSIALSIEELKDLDENWDDLPESFSLVFKHHGKKSGKDVLSIYNVGGTSATHLLGRFATNNKDIETLVYEIANHEQANNPDVIFAEIVHLPESRTGNILMRPSFREFEIPYLAKSNLPREQQIKLDDLYISIRNNNLILWSKQLNKQVIPRLGNAHNFSFNALPVYQFLCDLQAQNQRRALYFDWGSLKYEFSFLPRVEVDNVIISFATWQLRSNEYKELTGKNVNVIDSVSDWQKKWNLPNLILLVDGDNELLINLKDELSLKMFVSIIKKRSDILLKEFLFDEENAIVKDDKGNSYTNEFIAILQKPANKSQQLKSINPKELKENPIKQNLPSLIQRNFSLGSEWLYYKIYCGVKTADKILTELIKPLTEKLIQEKLIDSWFFIRYADPELHLRIRVHVKNNNLLGKIIYFFQQEIFLYENTKLIWKTQVDTYQREIERYGIDTMLLTENLFYHDSKCIVEMLDMIDGDYGEEIRWLFAIRLVDELLLSFKFSTQQKKDLMENLKIGFAEEFNMNRELKMQLDKKYRDKRTLITDILNRDKDKNSEIEPLFKILNEKSIQIQSTINDIIKIKKEKENPSLYSLIASYIHMSLNRLFKNKQRLHEMVIYDFMWRTYRSELAIQKSKKQILIND